MNISNVKVPSIYAKLKGMYARKIKSPQKEELLKQTSTAQVVALLKSFDPQFKELEQNPERSNIEILLDNILIEEIQKIIRMLNKKDKEVFLQFLSIYEIKCIKSVFRKLLANSTLQDETGEVKNWTSKIFIHLVGLEKVTDYESLCNLLRKTRYYNIFANYAVSQDLPIFEIENSLDRTYFKNMMKYAKNYNKNLEDKIGKQIDLNNVIWIYRIKKYYCFSKEKIRASLIDLCYRLKKSELEALVQSQTTNEMIEILKKTYYAKYIDFNELESLKDKIEQYEYHQDKKIWGGSIFDISMIYSYLDMIEKENNDILNIVEGIRYHLNYEEIQKKLVY